MIPNSSSDTEYASIVSKLRLNDKHKTKKPKTDSDYFLNRVLIFANIIIAGGTFAMAVMNYYLVQDSGRQIDNAIEQTKIFKSSDSTNAINTNRSLIIAENSLLRSDSALNLTKQSLELAQKNFRIENRPYMIADVDEIELEVGKPAKIYFNVKNIGKCPAYYHIAIDDTICYFIDFFNKKPSYKTLDETLRKSFPNIIPMNQGGKISTMRTDTISKEIKGLLDSERIKWFVWVNIIYKDIFGNEYFTRVCGFVTKDGLYPIGEYNAAN